MLWIYICENPEIKYNWGFISLKLLIKGTAVNLLQTKKSCWFISLKILKKKYHLGFLLLKLLVKSTGVNSFKVEQSYGLISLKMRKWSTIVYLFCLNYGYKVRLWIYLKQKRAVDSYHRRCWTKVPLGISFVETPDKKYGCEFI